MAEADNSLRDQHRKADLVQVEKDMRTARNVNARVQFSEFPRSVGSQNSKLCPRGWINWSCVVVKHRIILSYVLICVTFRF